MNSHTSGEVKGQSIGLVTAIVDGASRSSKEVMVTRFTSKPKFSGY